jgi:hypothetical protein
MAGRGVSLEPAPEPAYNTVHHVRPWLVKCKAGRALPPADRLAAFVPFEKQLRRLSDARSAERGRLIEDISARHRRHATDYVQRL